MALLHTCALLLVAALDGEGAAPAASSPPAEPPPAAAAAPTEPATPAPTATPAAAPAADAPVAMVAEEPGAASTAEGKAPSEFVKGELSMYLGSDRLVVKNTRVGVSAGLDDFQDAWYLLVEPLLDLRFLDGKLGIGLGVPLRLEIADFRTKGSSVADVFARAGMLRTADYATPHDFGRILKYVTFGRKEDRLYISAGQRYASTLGHGAIMRRYAPNIDVNYPRASAQLDAYGDYGGFEAFTNDLLEWNTIGALGFVKPLALLSKDNLLTSTFSLGVTAATDRTAPLAIQTDANGVRQLTANNTRFAASSRPVTLFGVDAEVKVVKTASVDVKPYVDYSMLQGGDGGLTLGVLGRFNVGQDTINAFRVVAEVRSLGSHYDPSYFGTFYEIERYVYFTDTSDPSRTRYVPKGDYVLTNGLGQRMGYYAEASWGIPGKVGLTLSLEGVSNAPGKNAIAHLELPVLDFLQLFGSFYKRGLTDFGQVARLDDKTILYAGGRLKILPFLFVNGRAYKTFRMDDALQRYSDQFGFAVDVELGYEFRKSEAPPPKDQAPAPTPAEGTSGDGHGT